MIVARFGGQNFAAAYEFPLSLVTDDWQGTRPPVVQKVSATAGVFDPFGGTNFPVAPVLVKKSFALVASSSSAIDDARDTLKAATYVHTTNDRLWFLDRDGSTKYWCYGKCVRFKASETYKEKGRFLKKVNLDFFCREGLWYGDTTQTYTDTGVSGISSFSLTNSGNYPALVACAITARGSGATDITVDNQSAVIGTIGVQFIGTVAINTAYGFSSTTYAAATAAGDAYANQTLTGNTSRVCWFWLEPGANTVVTESDSTTYDTSIIWEHTYVMV